MKKNTLRKLLPVTMALAFTVTSIPLTALADSTKVVTLGANLTNDQKMSMYKYFGTTVDEVDTIEVTNQDERKYMEGIASEAQIGTKTFSCSYVEPTTEGGIQVKVANLTFVTSSMIASTLTTSGVENCNVVAASPMEVSGTGALTGIMMAYEEASGETLNEDQKAAATEELVTTGELADDIGQEEATSLMNEVKEEVIEEGVSDPSEIQDIVTQAADSKGVTLTDDQVSQITSLMEKISQYDYDVKALKETLDNLDGKEEGFIQKIVSSITSVFKGDSNDGGIINNTDDSILGENAIVDSTLDALSNDSSDDEESTGFFGKIINFFKNLIGSDSSEGTVESSTPADLSVAPEVFVEEEPTEESSEEAPDPEDPSATVEEETEDTTTENSEEAAPSEENTEIETETTE